MSFTRFAIYYVPAEGALADFGATWLGWDLSAARPSRQPDVPGLDDVTMTPRKYGFHGTLKPPFRLAEGSTLDSLNTAVADMAQRCAPAQSEGLALTALGRFLALTPVGDTSGISRVAATCVETLDVFRAPPDMAELARRRKSRLSAKQDALLLRWGYPYVMDEFRFHLTLTGRVLVEDTDHWLQTVQAHMPSLPAPFALDAVALVGERPDGRFELIHRYALTG
ncbi:MAG: DUF1045 domain-containing protein [Marivita sp.]|uniref:DUF1045 domain-containing protein n=1 Tax=Marivita sp. TaxID=2003365 RepID=UPI003EF4C8D0